MDNGWTPGGISKMTERTVAIAPTPWHQNDDGNIEDANGEIVAILAVRLDRQIGNQIAAAPQLEAALEELIEYIDGMLASPLLVEAGGGAPVDPPEELKTAREALARARKGANREARLLCTPQF